MPGFRFSWVWFFGIDGLMRAASHAVGFPLSHRGKIMRLGSLLWPF